MRIEFTNGNVIEKEPSEIIPSVVMLRTTIIRGTRRYEVAFGNEHNAIAHGVTKETFYTLLEAVDGGNRKVKSKAR